MKAYIKVDAAKELPFKDTLLSSKVTHWYKEIDLSELMIEYVEYLVRNKKPIVNSKAVSWTDSYNKKEEGESTEDLLKKFLTEKGYITIEKK